MLTHLHHTPRVGPTQHRWAKDAVVAAQLGAAALVVVTALEWRSDLRGSGAPGHAGAPADMEWVQEGDLSQIAIAGASKATQDFAFATAPEITMAPTNADVTPSAAVPADAPAPGDSVVPAETAMPAETAPPAGANGPPSIDLAVQSGASTAAFGAPMDAFGSGPVQVQVVDEAYTTVARAEVTLGDVVRIADLPAGTYRLILIQTTGVTEPSPGMAISAAQTRKTDPVQLAAGDVLLVSLQARPVTTG